MSCTTRLQRVAQALQPIVAPFHVNSASLLYRAPGWYWQPAGATGPEYLGYNHIVAEMALLELLDGAAASNGAG